MDNKIAPKKGMYVTKTTIKVMNLEKEFFPKMSRMNAKPSGRGGDRTSSSDEAKRALKELLMA